MLTYAHKLYITKSLFFYLLTLLILHNWLRIHSALIYVNFLLVATIKEQLVGKFKKLLASPHSLSPALYHYNSLRYPTSWELHCQALHP